jgi:hypothetical protein
MGANEKKKDETEVYTDRYYGKVYRSFTLPNDPSKNTRSSGRGVRRRATATLSGAGMLALAAAPCISQALE